MRITIDIKKLQDFCNYVDKSLGGPDYVRLEVKEGNLQVHSSSTLGTVYYSIPVEATEDVSVGVFAYNLYGTVKKLYGEEVDLVFGKNSVEVRKDNIKVSLPVVTDGGDLHIPRSRTLKCDSRELADHIIKSVEVLDKTGFVGNKGSCVFLDS